MILRGLAYRYPFSGGFQLGPLDVEGPDDRPWLILGPPGSGKSTLLRLLGGNLRPQAGAIEGYDPGAEAVYLPQFPERALAGRNLAEDLSGEIRPAQALRTRLRQSLRRVGLKNVSLSRASRTLSAGERRRAALALLVLADHPHWALDEVDAGLDATGVRQLLEILGQRPSGGRIWIASHRFGVYRSLNPWTVVMYDGARLDHGELDAVLGRPAVARALALADLPAHRFWAGLRGLGAVHGAPFEPPPGGGLPPQLFRLLEDTAGAS